MTEYADRVPVVSPADHRGPTAAGGRPDGSSGRPGSLMRAALSFPGVRPHARLLALRGDVQAPPNASRPLQLATPDHRFDLWLVDLRPEGRPPPTRRAGGASGRGRRGRLEGRPAYRPDRTSSRPAAAAARGPGGRRPARGPRAARPCNAAGLLLPARPEADDRRRTEFSAGSAGNPRPGGRRWLAATHSTQPPTRH